MGEDLTDGSGRFSKPSVFDLFQVSRCLICTSNRALGIDCCITTWSLQPVCLTTCYQGRELSLKCGVGYARGSRIITGGPMPSYELTTSSTDIRDCLEECVHSRRSIRQSSIRHLSLGGSWRVYVIVLQQQPTIYTNSFDQFSKMNPSNIPYRALRHREADTVKETRFLEAYGSPIRGKGLINERSKITIDEV